MKILAFSDWRTQSIQMLNKLIQDCQPDAILYAGDDLRRIIPLSEKYYFCTKNHFIEITDQNLKNIEAFKRNARVNELIKQLANHVKVISTKRESIHLQGIPFYYVNGNDKKIINKNGDWYLKITPLSIPAHAFPPDKYITENLSKKIIITKDKSMTRFSDGIYAQLCIPPSFGKHDFNDSTSLYGCLCASEGKFDIIKAPDSHSNIYLSHIPPKGILDLSIRYGLDHVGSTKLRKSIDLYKPRYVICGHSHFWGGNFTKYKNTIILNVSSNDKANSPGNYVIIDTVKNTFKMHQVEVKALPNIRGGSFNIHEKLEIFGIDDCAKIDEYNLLDGANDFIIKKLKESNKLKLADRVQSLNWNAPKIVSKINFDPDLFAFIDVETGLMNGNNPGNLWLIGVFYKKKILHFVYPKDKKPFIKFIKDNKITTFISWTQYDRSVLTKLPECTNIKWIDACQRVSNSLIWHTYELHELYTILSHHKTPPMISGNHAGIFADHLIIQNKKCQFCPPKDVVIEQVKTRNKTDLLQMFWICKHLWVYNQPANTFTK